jgi:hypothetical protein
MALVTQSNSSVPFSPLAPFTGVNNATVRLLKAISAAELALLRDGDTVYVESVRDYWKWVPTSTATDDSTGDAAQLRYCNPTVNGANPGRFERLFIRSPDWLLQDFFIDSTAGVGNNENTGASALVPLNNDNELYQRWGDFAQLTTPRTVTYIQSPTTQTNYDVQFLGGSLTLLGTRTLVLGPVVLTAVTVQNRATQTPWDITGPGLGAAHVGLIVQITASGVPANVGAYATIVKDLGGGKVRVSPFGTKVVSTVSFNVVTPVAGDTVEVISFPTLQTGKIRFRLGSNINFTASPLTNCAVIDLLKLEGSSDAASLVGIVICESTRVFYQRVVQSRMRWGGFGGTLHFFCGGHIITGSVSFLAGSTCNLDAVAIGNVLLSALPGCSVVMRKDCIFQAGGWGVVGNCRINSQGTAYFDSAGIGCNLAFGVYSQTGAIADWGTNNTSFGIGLSSGAFYIYVTKPTINATLGVGRETRIGGTDKLYGAIPYVEGANLAGLVLLA